MEAVGRLAGGIAHDFNNVLTAIFGYTDLLLEQLPADDLSRERRAGDPSIRGARRIADAPAARIQPQAGAAAASARPERGHRQRSSRCSGGWSARHVDIEVSCGVPLSKVRADPGQIEQVLMNLCANARDAMPEGGVVEIRTEDRSVTSAEASTRAGLQAGFVRRC